MRPRQRGAARAATRAFDEERRLKKFLPRRLFAGADWCRGWFGVGVFLWLFCPGTWSCSVGTFGPPLVFSGVEKTGVSGSVRDVNMLVRAFLLSDTIEPKSRYGYYVYLLFADRSAASRGQRVEALIQVSRLFEDVTAGLRRRPASELAVLYIPCVSADAGEKFQETKDVQEFEAAGFDYAMSKDLLLRLRLFGANRYKVTLVGAPRPLHEPSAVDWSDTVVVELDLFKPEEIETEIKKFEAALYLAEPYSTGAAVRALSRACSFLEITGASIGIVQKTITDLLH